jgi:hypothetical protein
MRFSRTAQIEEAPSGSNVGQAFQPDVEPNFVHVRLESLTYIGQNGNRHRHFPIPLVSATEEGGRIAQPVRGVKARWAIREVIAGAQPIREPSRRREVPR